MRAIQFTLALVCTETKLKSITLYTIGFTHLWRIKYLRYTYLYSKKHVSLWVLIYDVVGIKFAVIVSLIE